MQDDRGSLGVDVTLPSVVREEVIEVSEDIKNRDEFADDDPFGLADLKDDATSTVPVQKVMGGFIARKPKKTEFFRVHPTEGLPTAYIYEDKNDEPGADEVYWVRQEARHLLPVKKVRLFLCSNRSGQGFLWPAKKPGDTDNTRTASLYDSALQVADKAVNRWVRMEYNPAGFYDYYVAESDLGEPVWPDLPLPKLLALAFKPSMIIADNEHFIVRNLRGAV